MSDKSYIILALFPGRATYIIFIYRRNRHRYHLMRGMKLLKSRKLANKILPKYFLILTTLFKI